MQTEAAGRGFDYLLDGGAQQTRLKRWINDANHRINNVRPWTFLDVTTSGAAPIAITNLNRLERVVSAVDVNSPLTALPRAQLADMTGSLAITGAPVYFYLTASVSGVTVNVYPVSTATLTVDYQKVDTDMVASGDVPSMPDRFRPAIVDLAVAAALKDKSNWSEAQAAEQSAFALVDQMVDWDVMLSGQPGRQVIVGASDDW